VLGFIRPTLGTTLTPPMTFTAGTNMSLPAAGSFEYDGSVFYGSPTASQRGVLNTMPFICMSGDFLASDAATAQKVFNSPSNGTITLPGATAYMFEAVYFITRSAGSTSHTFATLFGGTATLTSITYVAETTSTATNVLGAVSRIIGTAATATVCTAASTATNEVFTVTLRGALRTNSGGSFIPQFQYSAASGGAPTILKNSYFRLTPIGTSSVNSVGNWN
jgi:hypothetical protein